MTDTKTDAEIELQAWRDTREERASGWVLMWSLRSLLLLRGRDWYHVETKERDWREERAARRAAVIARLARYARQDIERELLEIEKYSDSPIEVLRELYPRMTQEELDRSVLRLMLDNEGSAFGASIKVQDEAVGGLIAKPTLHVFGMEGGVLEHEQLSRLSGARLSGARASQRAVRLRRIQVVGGRPGGDET